jgi:tetratricopeptide (TPR) repeat protein
MANLATIYHAQSRCEEAESMHVKVLKLRQKVLGQEHPDTIWSMANLATMYAAQGLYKEAEVMQIKALELRQKVLGQEHPETIWSVAQTRQTRRKYPGAQNRDEEAESV